MILVLIEDECILYILYILYHASVLEILEKNNLLNDDQRLPLTLVTRIMHISLKQKHDATNLWEGRLNLRFSLRNFPIENPGLKSCSTTDNTVHNYGYNNANLKKHC